jgi:hypothetical protein
MVKIYRIKFVFQKNGAFKYQAITMKDPSDRKGLREFKAIKKLPNWEFDKKIFIIDNELEKGDFYNFMPTCLVMREKAYTVLNGVLKEHDEILPWKVESENIFVLNVLTNSNSIIEDKSNMDALSSRDWKLCFDQNRLPDSSIFKIPQDNYFDIFCHQGLLPPEKDFKHLVESNNLKGLEFKEVWSSE